MTERVQQPNGSGQQTEQFDAPPSEATDVRSSLTFPSIPSIPPVREDAEDDPTILGFPAETAETADDAEGLADETKPDPAAPQGELVVVRHPDRVGAAVLVLGGVAANVSLFLPWMPGEGTYGLYLVQQGVVALVAGLDELAASGAWQPLTVVVSGGLFVLLGLLLLAPARSHRLLGVLALLVAMLGTAAVIALLAQTGWRVERFEIGMWFAVAVPGLGLLGALKAMLTAPHVRIARRRPAASEVAAG